jgi:dihydrofolate reductase
MTGITADISMSLDGFVTGPDPGPDNGLGTGGEALHTWAFSDDPDDERYLREGTARSGAVVLGRWLFDVVDGPDGWDDETGYGAREVGRPAFVVVTSAPPDSVRLADLDVVLMGGGATIGSALDAGLVDALTVHLAPVVLGSGTPLFTGRTRHTLVQRSATVTTTATHLTYEVG